MLINGATRLVGVIGHPVEHSLSPRMHNASFEVLGLDLCYVPLDVRPERLREAVLGLAALGFLGFNVTMPHKAAVASLVDELDDASRVSGAVNTVVVEGERLRGLNTDGVGFVEACREAGVKLAGKSVLMVGAGGAAAAIGVALVREGVEHLTVANRTGERASALAGGLGGEVSAAPIEELERLGSEADVLVNATYLGMREDDPLPFPQSLLVPGRVICDAVYRGGAETALVKAGRERGCTVVAGQRMLLYQGVVAQREWTGVEPAVEVMSDALL